MALHDGHRARLREQFLNAGLQSFSEVQVLELLLSYAIPRKDTNEIAHNLITRFGSLPAVLDAPAQALRQTDGIGEQAAVLLTLMPQLLRRYEQGKRAGGTILNTTEKLGAYVLPCFTGTRDEQVYLLCLDAKCKLLDCRMLFSGSINTVGISVRKIVETALAVGATSVVLAHNHVSGIALPSREDEVTTRMVIEAMEPIGIYLADHLIVADGDFVSMAESGLIRRA